MKHLLLAAALGLTGCATHTFSEPTGKWTSHRGQLLYREGTRSIVGELTVASQGANAKLEFSKGPGIALLTLQRDATHARFEGPLARLAHTVSLPVSAGSRDAGWLSIIDRSAKESKFNLTSGGAQFSVQLAPGR